MKVICISAKARHGKDTAAEILKEYFEAANKKVLVIHYADLLKFICTKFFNWDGNKDEKGRTLLQYVGTGVVGKQNPAYWVEFIKGVLKLFPDEWDYVIIPDCRYPIEVSEMQDLCDTVVLRIERPNFDNGLSDTQKNHPSEIDMDDYPFDAIIYNDGGLAELRKKLAVWFVENFLFD